MPKIPERLNMPHLASVLPASPSAAFMLPDDLTAAAESLEVSIGAAAKAVTDPSPAAAIRKTAEPEKPADPRDLEVYEFALDFTDSRDKHWGGPFKNTVLTIQQRSQADVLRAQLNGGMPEAAMSEDVALTNRALAHMTFSLDRTTRPKWAQNLLALRDPTVVLALWNEVAGHEAHYFRIDQAPPEGPEADGDG